MKIGLDDVQKYIETQYAEDNSWLVFTKRISERLSKTIVDIVRKNAPSATEIDVEEIHNFLQKEETVAFIKEREPNQEKVSDDVMKHVKEYFENSKGLSGYTILDVCRASNHKEDEYLYCVMAEKDGKYSCWSSWNEKTLSLNFGHYGYDTKEAAFGKLKELFYDVTLEPQKYGIEKTRRSFQEYQIEQSLEKYEAQISEEKEAENVQAQEETFRRKRGR